MSKEKTYREVASIFADFNKNIVKMEKAEELVNDEDFSELGKQYATLSDGQIIEICFWHESDMFLYDLSVDNVDSVRWSPLSRSLESTFTEFQVHCHGE